MIRINKLIRFAFIAIITLLYGCSKDEDIIEQIAANGKTSLFEQVTEPELNTNSSELYEVLSSDDSSSSTGDWGVGNPNGQTEPGVLTAGEWNDLNNWDFLNNLLRNQEYYEDVNRWKLKKIKRYSFLVKDTNESLVANAEISLLSGQVEIWKTKTDNHGKATLWSDLELDRLTARVKFEETEERVVDVIEYAEGINNIHLNRTIVNKKIIDIYFAVDATGSMGDEINYLKVELNDVIERIKRNNTSLEMRFG